MGKEPPGENCCGIKRVRARTGKQGTLLSAAMDCMLPHCSGQVHRKGCGGSLQGIRGGGDDGMRGRGT